MINQSINQSINQDTSCSWDYVASNNGIINE
jgi:hypothetical protein